VDLNIGADMDKLSSPFLPPSMTEIIPPGERGTAKIVHMTVDQEAVNLYNYKMLMMRSAPWMMMQPGTYAKLIVEGVGIMMSDTKMERLTNAEVLRDANGHVLIGGLGIGMLPVTLLRPDRPENRAVKSVTVVELNPDVVELVAPHIVDPRLTIAQGDVFEWVPPDGVLYDTIYMDIWPQISTENLPEMRKLHRRYKRYLNDANPRSFMTSWVFDKVQREARKGRSADF
jgi:hypothetical protein